MSKNRKTGTNILAEALIKARLKEIIKDFEIGSNEQEFHAKYGVGRLKFLALLKETHPDLKIKKRPPIENTIRDLMKREEEEILDVLNNYCMPMARAAEKLEVSAYALRSAVERMGYIKPYGGKFIKLDDMIKEGVRYDAITK